MTVSRKLFVEVAAEFNAARKLAKSNGEIQAVRDCAERMARIFKSANPAFDTSRFMTACGF